MEAALARLVAAKVAEDGGAVVPLAKSPLGEPLRALASGGCPNRQVLEATGATVDTARKLSFCAQQETAVLADGHCFREVLPAVAAIQLLADNAVSRAASDGSWLSWSTADCMAGRV